MELIRKYNSCLFIILLLALFPLSACNSQEQEKTQFTNTGPIIENFHSEENIVKEYKEFLNIAYAEIPGAEIALTSLDIYAPESGENHPVVIYIHGGAWVSGDKINVESKPDAFTDCGYLFISINYRLSPEVQHPVHVQDIATAIAWVKDNCTDYGGDSRNIFLIGHSAGAHLSALTATDDTHLKEKGVDLNTIKGVILLDGLGYNIPHLIEEYDFGSLPLYKIPFGEDKENWIDASPVTHVEQGKGIPSFLLIYVEDSPSTREDAELLAEKLNQSNIDYKIMEAKGKTHSSLNKEIGKPGDDITGEILHFIDNLCRTPE